ASIATRLERCPPRRWARQHRRAAAVARHVSCRADRALHGASDRSRPADGKLSPGAECEARLRSHAHSYSAGDAACGAISGRTAAYAIRARTGQQAGELAGRFRRGDISVGADDEFSTLASAGGRTAFRADWTTAAGAMERFESRLFSGAWNP